MPALPWILVPVPLALSSFLPAQGPGERLTLPGGGWRTTRVDLEIVVDPLAARVDVSGTQWLVLEEESSAGPTLAINLEEPLQRFLAVDAPPGWKVALNERFREHTRLALLEAPGVPLTRGAELELGFALEQGEGGRGVQAGDGFALAGWTSVWYPAPVPTDLENAVPAKLLAAVGTTRLHLPAGWTSVSNGERVERISEEDGVVETWRVDDPVARSFAAGPYRVASQRAGGREVTVYGLTVDPETMGAQAAALAAAIAAMEARFGAFPYRTFAIAEVPPGRVSFYGSSEQGFVLATSEAFHAPGGNLPLFAHEAAHGWWGNLLAGRGPAGILLTESLAQYGAVVSIEAVEGPAAATEFLRFSRPGYVLVQCARGFFELWRDGHDKPLVELTSGGWDHQLSDAKGHWVYHMLRQRVGDERFFGTLRRFVEERARGMWTLAELRAAFLAAAPEAGLETFFAQWLERPGAPILEHALERAADGAWELVVRQVQPGEPYELPLEVDVVSAGGKERLLLQLRGREERARLAAADEPSAVALDPEHKLLIWDPEYGPRPER